MKAFIDDLKLPPGAYTIGKYWFTTDENNE
jgi:hypothetical protein